MANRELAVRHTVTFVQTQLERAPGRRILEVGCGDGDVALALKRAGFHIVAVDSSPECVARAADKGIDVRHARWPAFDEEGFDAVLFTRSLHHVHELGGGLDKAVEALNPCGRLLVEDFSYTGATTSHARWLTSVARLLDAGGNEFLEGSLCRLMLHSGGDIGVWRQQHDHDLHDAPTMREEISRRLELVESCNVPYLYRYVVEGLATPAATHLLESVFELESRMGELDDHWLTGRRFVALKS